MTVKNCVAFCNTQKHIYAARMAKIVVSAHLSVAFKGSSSLVTLCSFHLTFWMPECGNVTTIGAKSAPPSDCNSKCIGNASETCGGINCLNLYWSGATPPPQPTIVQTVGWWGYGDASGKHICFALLFGSGPVMDMHFANSDSNDARILAKRTLVKGGPEMNSIESCTGACKDAGYVVAGMEFANKCCVCFTSSL